MKELEALRNRHDNRKTQGTGTVQETVNIQSKVMETSNPVFLPPPPLPCVSNPSPSVLSPKLGGARQISPCKPYDGVHHVKPIRVSPPKPGRMYPCLSDIEMTTENESDYDEDDADDEEERQINQAPNRFLL